MTRREQDTGLKSPEKMRTTTELRPEEEEELAQEPVEQSKEGAEAR
jgi:hypothetical protein